MKAYPSLKSPLFKNELRDELDISKQMLDIQAIRGGRYFPKPTRLAHELVNRFRKGKLKEDYHII